MDILFSSLEHDAQPMPGPTGELNVLSTHARGTVLCLGPDLKSAMHHAVLALSQGNAVVVIAPGAEADCQAAIASGLPVRAISGLLHPQALASVTGIAAVASCAEKAVLQAYRVALSSRDGVLLPLITERNASERFTLERHLCIDTTAAGGNASLIAASE